MKKKGVDEGWKRALDGMWRAANNENPDWADLILERAVIWARTHRFFDVNEVNLASPDCQPKNPGSWGSRTLAWCSQCWCRVTGVIITAKKPSGHRHKLCQLESLIYEENDKEDSGDK